MTVTGSERRARRFLREHWHLVERVATALLQRRTLAWEQVEAIVGGGER